MIRKNTGKEERAKVPEATWKRQRTKDIEETIIIK